MTYIIAQNDVFGLFATANNTDFKGAISSLTSIIMAAVLPSDFTW
ncbi:hypothetical protein BDK61_2971 [Haloarcula quadrata]|uniref:Uncharacterized protein n=1 Tax=Haloarcula quadrata TaxID=182779 RepID=A0A495R8D2_9EURY|nr:hypothetical protein BDK61_2971 [Haloarcula quadrata]